jgi:hypothetical protein
MAVSLVELKVAKTAEKKVDLMAEQMVAPSVVW